MCTSFWHQFCFVKLRGNCTYLTYQCLLWLGSGVHKKPKHKNNIPEVIVTRSRGPYETQTRVFKWSWTRWPSHGWGFVQLQIEKNWHRTLSREAKVQGYVFNYLWRGLWTRGTLKFQIAFWALRPTPTNEANIFHSRTHWTFRTTFIHHSYNKPVGGGRGKWGWQQK